MGFSNGSIMTIWELTDNGDKGVTCRMNHTYRNKNTGEYVQDWGGYANFYGESAEVVRNSNADPIRIVIDSCDVSNKYTKEHGEKTYYKVWKCHEYEKETVQKEVKENFMDVPDTLETELPFK